MVGFFIAYGKLSDILIRCSYSFHYYFYLKLKQTHSIYEFSITRTICSFGKRF
jgi:hypothetical protein